MIKRKNFPFCLFKVFISDTIHSHLLARIIPIILNLIVFMSLTEGHTIWVHNKLVAEAIASTQDTKTRGPFNNNQDFCWHFHGSLNDWDVYAC
ncbi:unnamed protein product [Rhizophagus irregularis]|nr:unnamed protein product [Rhizophagus irregularis]